MDESQKQIIRELILEHFGVSNYNHLICIIKETFDRGKFCYWQKNLFVELHNKTKFAISTVEEYTDIFHDAKDVRDPLPEKEITLEQFLTDPNRYLNNWLEPILRPDNWDDWITQAWERSDEFRENFISVYVREISKTGSLDSLYESLRQLTSILPISKNIELYCTIRDSLPQEYESGFRPTFERIFGARMAKFPAPLPTNKEEFPFTDEELTDMYLVLMVSVAIEEKEKDEAFYFQQLANG